MSDYTPTWFEIREQVENNTYFTADELDRMIDQERAEEREQADREPSVAEVEAAAKAMREQAPANMPIWDDWVWARFTRAALIAAQGVRND